MGHGPMGHDPWSMALETPFMLGCALESSSHFTCLMHPVYFFRFPYIVFSPFCEASIESPKKVATFEASEKEPWTICNDKITMSLQSPAPQQIDVWAIQAKRKTRRQTNSASPITKPRTHKWNSGPSIQRPPSTANGRIANIWQVSMNPSRDDILKTRRWSDGVSQLICSIVIEAFGVVA